jgi:hypothetical protein
MVEDSNDAPWFKDTGLAPKLMGGDVVDGRYHLTELTTYGMSATGGPRAMG